MRGAAGYCLAVGTFVCLSATTPHPDQFQQKYADFTLNAIKCAC